MTLEQAESIIKAARSMDIDDEVRLYGAEPESYSGRGMFGNTTTAVTGPRDLIAAAMGRAGLDPRAFRWDSMGKTNSVAY